jgi:hypothetical protein
MLRSRRIPPLLERVTGDGIHTALLVTGDGELLGSFTTEQSADAQHDPPMMPVQRGCDGQIPVVNEKIDLVSVSALVAEVVGDYKRAGHELSFIRGAPLKTSSSIHHQSQDSSSSSANNASSMYPLKCLLLEMEYGIIGIVSTAAYTVSSPSRADCYIAAIGDASVCDHPGLLKSRLSNCAGFVGEALLHLAEAP